MCKRLYEKGKYYEYKVINVLPFILHIIFTKVNQNSALLKKVITLLFTAILINSIFSQETGVPSTLPDVKFHLTSRPWKPLNIPRTAYLDRVEGIVREIAKFQNSKGAIIDPYSHREIQYSTPYFANAIATLVSAGRAKDLLDNGIAAMNSATADVKGGVSSIPDNHGEFFLAPLSSAIPLYKPYVSDSLQQIWITRMGKPVAAIIRGRTHNWRTYAMKGEWYRTKYGYIDNEKGVSWLESSWKNSQKRRFTNNIWNFYHDETSDPDTWQYDAAARGNLLTMMAEGYDGPSGNEILDILKKGTQTSLLLQDPTGQATAGGRSGNHSWNDIVFANGYETLAEIVNKEGNSHLAGQYRRAAALGFQSTERWKRNDNTYAVTKNHFDPEDRTRYATYSNFTNYNGYMMFHMSENYLRHQSDIPEQPTPNEIGGYTIVSDPTLATAVANAGGMHMEVCLRGATATEYNLFWTTLGAVRFSRTGWDSRLGPSDGVRETSNKDGVSFAPTFKENGKWVRLASIPERYEAFFSTQFANPLLVRCRIDYKPKSGKTGPTFTNNFVITPDGILSMLTSTSANFGMTWPILTYDGATQLNTNLTSHIASASFSEKGDQQNFISLHSSPSVTGAERSQRTSYGDVLPVRMVSGEADNVTFIYPRNPEDPSAESVRQSFTHSDDNFSTLLGKISGNTYVGRTSAGGEASSIDIDNDSVTDVTFSTKCGFVMQLENEKISNIEADRDVTAIVYGQTIQLKAYTPADIKNSNKPAVVSVIASTDDGNIPSNTVDKDINTRWSGLGNNQWIRYYFDTICIIKAIKIAWYKGDLRNASFDIQTSRDGVNWTAVYSGTSSGTTTSLETYEIPPTSAQYVRIVGHSNTLNAWNAITEVQFLTDDQISEKINRSIFFVQDSVSVEMEQRSSKTINEYISTTDSIPANAILTAVDSTGKTPEWLTLHGKIINKLTLATGADMVLGFNASNLIAGKYSAVITASSPGYRTAVLHISLTVKPGPPLVLTNLKMNFYKEKSKHLYQ